MPATIAMPLCWALAACATGPTTTGSPITRPAIPSWTLSLAFDYGQMNAVMSVVKDYKLEVKEQDFALSCCLVVAVRRNLADQVLEKLAGISTVTPL